MTLNDTALVAALRAELGARAVLTDPDVTAAYTRDMMPLAPAGKPLAVVLPTDLAGVRATVRACARARVPIVPRGAGSGLSGAANAIDGCVVLVLTKMDRIVEIDVGNRLAVVEPGVVTHDLRVAAGEHGLFYPPDPSSYEWCTVGGNLATNAGGLCCVKYGVTTDSVLGLEVVLADGSVLRTGRRTVKGVAGYDLTRLFVGSEGTLGVITQATVSLRPLPSPPVTLVATFPGARMAGEAVHRVVRAGLVPSLMEIMDATSIRAAETHLGTDLGTTTGTAAMLLCQSDTGDPTASAELRAIQQICTDTGADLVYATEDRAEGELLMQARRTVLTALERHGTALTDDVCVPRTRIADLITGCERIAEQSGLRIAVVGHAGDGNMHPTIVYAPDAPDELAQAKHAFDEILTLGLALGGTVTGEHGIGRLKQDWLARELGPVGLAVHRQIKTALDPGHLFNPGAMFAGGRGGAEGER